MSTSTLALDFLASAPQPLELTSVPAAPSSDAKAKKGTRVRRGIQNKELTPTQAAAMEDAIGTVAGDAQVKPTKRTRVRNAKAETLPAASVKTEIAVSPLVAGKYKLASTPAGRKLYTYTLAVFTVLGMFTAHRKAVRKEDIVAFFQSKKIVDYHKENGGLEETANGGIRLSAAGWNYFHGRLTGSTYSQKVDKPEMEALAEAIRKGELVAATERFPVSTRFVPIKAS